MVEQDLNLGRLDQDSTDFRPVQLQKSHTVIKREKTNE